MKEAAANDVGAAVAPPIFARHSGAIPPIPGPISPTSSSAPVAEERLTFKDFYLKVTRELPDIFNKDDDNSRTDNVEKRSNSRNSISFENSSKVGNRRRNAQARYGNIHGDDENSAGDDENVNQRNNRNSREEEEEEAVKIRQVDPKLSIKRIFVSMLMLTESTDNCLTWSDWMEFVKHGTVQGKFH